jgi:hypothetical protein
MAQSAIAPGKLRRQNNGLSREVMNSKADFSSSVTGTTLSLENYGRFANAYRE